MSLRQVILDTETTGLNFKGDDRIVEIGCVELINRSLSGNNFHRYLNPGRDSDPGALAVHGLTREFLSDKPKFADVATELCNYLEGAEVLIHNANFDVGFLNAELGRLKMPAFKEYCPSVIDTLAMAKELHPGKRNSLDSLCERYGVSNAHRTLHGALLDAEILAEVYLAMTRGQDSLMMDVDPVRQQTVETFSAASFVLKVIEATPEETEEHEAILGSLKKETRADPVWYRSTQKTAENAG
jgi:DNA polymerase-3 subunit epsilon